MKEIEAYYDLISNHFREKQIEQAAIINDPNKIVSRLFIKRFKINMPVVFGYDSTNVKIFTSFDNNVKSKQIIFYDNINKIIYGRIALITGNEKTSEEKIEMISDIIKSKM